MDNSICPVLYSGILANNSENRAIEEAVCLGSKCAWWDPKYKLCFLEMIALR